MSIIAWQNVMIIQKYDGKIVKNRLKGDPFHFKPVGMASRGASACAARQPRFSRQDASPTTKISISSIILVEDIYPRKGIDHRRVGIFAENHRDGFKFEPIEVEPDPDKPGKYRLLDGVHRWSAYKTMGVTETEAIIKDLDGTDSL